MVKKITVQVPEGLYKAFRIYSIESGETLTSFIRKSLEGVVSKSKESIPSENQNLVSEKPQEKAVVTDSPLWSDKKLPGYTYIPYMGKFKKDE